MKKIVFHYPEEIDPSRISASQIRPGKMLNAFSELGYDVIAVMGNGKKRKKDIKKIVDDRSVDNGFEFIYSESSTIGTLLTEKHHFPVYPFLDFGFLNWARKRSIPIGLFYRDIYWRFSQYNKGLPFYHKMVTRPFYYYDLFQYLRVVDHLFLPSKNMLEYLPINWPEERCSALPPGCDIVYDEGESYKGGEGEGLNLFYVGGNTPPLYDLRPLMEVIGGIENTILTICCRENEWKESLDLYSPFMNEKIRVVHASGEELKRYYSEAHVFIIYFSNDYRKFAVPFKVFEAPGQGVPLITQGGTETARIVEKEGLGWVSKDSEDLRRLITHLRDHPEEVEKKRKEVLEVRHRHTWKERARQVAETLLGKEE